MSKFSFYTHNGDRALAESLGLTDWQKTWVWRDDGWLYLGTVENERDGGPVDDPGWQVEVEVVSMPAQFWRFTVRTYLDVEVDGQWEHELQVIRFSTGSGGLGTFWPVAKMLAEQMIGLPELVTA